MDSKEKYVTFDLFIRDNILENDFATLDHIEKAYEDIK